MAADHRSGLDAALLLAASAVAWLILTPAGGSGWAWGAPLTELRWDATGLDSEATVLQLVGNLLQWALPLGRVVSPIDATLNATGALAGGLVVALATGRPGPRRVTRLGGGPALR